MSESLSLLSGGGGGGGGGGFGGGSGVVGLFVSARLWTTELSSHRFSILLRPTVG